MATIDRLDENSSNSSAKGAYPHDKKQDVYDDLNFAGEDSSDGGNHLHRGLHSRQITMIAIGGAIGTGLIIGT